MGARGGGGGFKVLPHYESTGSSDEEWKKMPVEEWQWQAVGGWMGGLQGFLTYVTGGNRPTDRQQREPKWR